MAVEANGRVLVIESHTHFRPEGYAGPKADRILAMTDTDGDGRADRITDVLRRDAGHDEPGGVRGWLGLRRHADGGLSTGR